MKTNLLKFAFVFVAMFGLGYWSAESFIFSEAGGRQSPALSSILMNAKMGKSLSFVNVQLESDSIPENPNDYVEVSGFITLLKSSNNSIRYQWLLPEGVEIVEGEKEGQYDSVAVESPVEVKIKVKGFSKYEKKLLTLSASTQIGDTSFSSVQLISSRPEDSHEYIAKQRYDSEKMQKLEFSSESPKEDLRSQEEKIQR